jgi:hypothetical protein
MNGMIESMPTSTYRLWREDGDGGADAHTQAQATHNADTSRVITEAGRQRQQHLDESDTPAPRSVQAKANNTTDACKAPSTHPEVPVTYDIQKGTFQHSSATCTCIGLRAITHALLVPGSSLTA